MPSKGSMIALKADPNDPEDGDVTVEAMEQALAERRGRLRRLAEADGEPVRLDRDVLAKFRATGEGWQARVNAVLRAADPLAHDGERDAA